MQNCTFMEKIKYILRYIFYTIIGFLIVIILFLVFYIASGKIAEKKGVNPPFGLFTAVGDSMEPSINKYDMVLIVNQNPQNLKVGDIITFYPPNNIFSSITVTHRIKEIVKEGNNIKFITKGDANKTIDVNMVDAEKVLGKAVIIIPKIGLIQNYIAENGPWIFLLFIPSVVFLISITARGIKLAKLKRQRDEVSDF